MKLLDLCEQLEIVNGSENLDIEIEGIRCDSRAVKPGDVFVCIEGFATDGHRYIMDAVEHGAKALIVQKEAETYGVPAITVKNTRRALAAMAHRFYDEPSRKFRLIGVTGTNGKTTVTHLLKHVLESVGRKVGLIGTNCNMIGDEVLSAHRTTPESIELVQLFHEMNQAGVTDVVMEVSSHALALDRVAGCDFDLAVFTNLTQDHLDFHENMEAYRDAKGKLFTMAKKAVINTDDEAGRYLFDPLKTKKMSFAIDSDADIRARQVTITEKGVCFMIECDEDMILSDTLFCLGIPGKFSVYNALAVIAACRMLEVRTTDIAKALKSACGVDGRAEVIETGRDFSVMIDYAHTPDGLENILKTVRGFAKGRVVTVFGCGGDRDKTKRPIMGKMAGNLSDYCVITSDNPRTEDPGAILLDIEKGMEETNCPYIVIENRKEAIKYALNFAQEGDVVLLAGKGHETYQILKDRTIEFDEKKIVRELLGM